MIKLYDAIDEDLWIDDTIPLELHFFATNDDILEYMGAHLEFPKSNLKKKETMFLVNMGIFG